jgi:uncharacterized protein (TIGR02145 family)
MKTKIILSAIALAWMASSYGQMSIVTLMFTAKYYDTTHYEQLDSIRVTNFTQGSDTMLYFPDTVLVLAEGLGIPGDYRLLGESGGLSCYPNPVITQATIRIYAPCKDKFEFRITDMDGKMLLSSDWQLDKGVHLFSFSPGSKGVFLLTALWKGNSLSMKIVSEVTVNQVFSLSKISAGSEKGIRSLKFQAHGFGFTPGDSLIYTGYAKTPAQVPGSDMIEDRPLNSQLYQFEIVEGYPCQDHPVIIYGGRIYKTVQIGTQCWLQSNLDFATGNSWCYDESLANCTKYGRLYDWETAVGVCPSGWHLATDDDFTILGTYLGGANGAGMKMKSTSGWYQGSNGNNLSGYTGVPGGRRYPDGTYVYLTRTGDFWSSSYSSTQAWVHTLYSDGNVLDRVVFDKTYGFSVRCIKD